MEGKQKRIRRLEQRLASGDAHRHAWVCLFYMPRPNLNRPGLDLDGYMAWVEAEHPEVVALEELLNEQIKPFHNFALEVTRLLDEHHPALPPVPLPPLPEGDISALKEMWRAYDRLRGSARPEHYFEAFVSAYLWEWLQGVWSNATAIPHAEIPG